jgi:hypothetical protein
MADRQETRRIASANEARRWTEGSIPKLAHLWLLLGIFALVFVVTLCLCLVLSKKDVVPPPEKVGTKSPSPLLELLTFG